MFFIITNKEELGRIGWHIDQDRVCISGDELVFEKSAEEDLPMAKVGVSRNMGVRAESPLSTSSMAPD